jgi:hypothetical protein
VFRSQAPSRLQKVKPVHICLQYIRNSRFLLCTQCTVRLYNLWGRVAKLVEMGGLVGGRWVAKLGEIGG